MAPLCIAGSGETVVRNGPAWYSLHRWVEGQQVSIGGRDALIRARPHLVRELAVMIATLHMVGSQDLDEGGEGDPDRLLRVPRANVRRIHGSRRRLVSRWQVLRLKPRKSDFDRWALRVLPEVAARAETLAKNSIAHRVPRSETGLIHNDVNWENLILDEGFHVRALLDFDNVVRAPWALEVGAGAVVLVGADPHTVDQFVSGYEATTGAAFDRDLVRLGMELKCVRSIITSVLAYLDGGTDTRLLAPWCHHLHESLQLVQQE
ncbi:Ser/Thr protein kinase RdoA (MazF antagonist) [Janibacter cremeus]|uniref:Ser/Thr protein kinase RdoA (MazF antagonist) n=1 Tax=Janibacter cremeus TaxID=1285192 RepID=A0A852VXS8_9MICO|nr:Ser/Thr protein kinase RdoA (MazF antagonist) [Janibacter cremeus]